MEYISGNIYADYIDIIQDTHFMSGSLVDVDAMNVRGSLIIENEANLFGDIYLCDGCNIGIQNSGTINGRVHVGTNTTLVQFVYSRDDMHSIKADAPYTISVNGANGLDWNDLYMMGAAAGTLVLNNSSIVLSDEIPMMLGADAGPRIELHGVVTVDLPDNYVAGNDAIMRNISGDARIIVNGGNPGDLYFYSAAVHDTELYIHLMRETDYYKILGDGRGLVLNRVRDVAPNDALLRRLDAAHNMDELEDIMSHSVAFNPMRLMRPVQVLDAFMAGGIHMDALSDDGAADGRIHSFVAMEQDWIISGASTDFIVRPISSTVIELSLYGAMLESDDDINVYSGQLFGGRIMGRYDNDIVMARFNAGMTMADFEVPYIFDGDDIHNHARGYGLYTVMDAGVRYGALVPYVGTQYHASRIMDETDVDFNARAGVESSLDIRGAEFLYVYKFGAGLNTDSSLYSGFGVRFTSYDDGFGCDASFNARRDDTDFAWMLSVSARVLF